MGSRHVANKQQLPRFAIAYIILVVVGAVLVVLFYWTIVTVQQISPVARDARDIARSARLDALKVALTTTAGLGAAAGLYVTYRRQRVEEGNSHREQDKVFTERFTVAAGLLAHESAAVRLAGVNSLARLADDSGRDRSTCLNTLCAYLRTPVPLAELANQDRIKSIAAKSCWADPDEWDVRRSAARLLSDRLRIAGYEPDSGEWLDLREAILVDLDLSDVASEVRADFSHCHFVGQTTFDSASFGDECAFAGACFHHSIGLDRATFGGRADFSGCEFKGEVSASSTAYHSRPIFDDCKFFKYTEFGWNGDDHYPSFRRARFHDGLRVDMTLYRYNMFRGSNSIELTTRRFDFTGAVFKGEILIPVGLSLINDADFSEAGIIGYDTFDLLGLRGPSSNYDSVVWPEGFDLEEWIRQPSGDIYNL
jgi:uncharacterized protein YjbI with pentapeptide repeats